MSEREDQYEDAYDHSLHADDDVEDEWDVLSRCWTQLRNVCLAVARGDHDEADEMMGEVIDRMPAIVERWDPTQGVPLRAYVFMTVRRYMHKRLSINGRRRAKTVSVDDVPEVAEPARDDDDVPAMSFDDVIVLVATVDHRCAELLMRRARGATIADVAYERDVSMREASQMCARALELARRLVRERRG